MLEYALHRPTKKLRHIDDVDNGRKCDCVCLECGDALEAHNKGKNQAHHFKHTTLTERRQCLMTQLHRWAQEYISEKKALVFDSQYSELPPPLTMTDVKAIRIDAVSATLEKKVGNYVADILMLTASGPLVIEIKVSHGCTEDKIDYLQAQQIPSVEIDLSQYVDTPINEVKPFIDSMIAHSTWFYIPNQRDHLERWQYERELQAAERKSKIKDIAFITLKHIQLRKTIRLPRLERRFIKQRETGRTSKTVNLLDNKIINLTAPKLIADNNDYIHFVAYLGSRPLHFVAQYSPDCVMPDIPKTESVIKFVNQRWEWHRNARERELAEKAKWPEYVTGRLKVEKPDS